MQLRNSEQSYGAIAKLLHWLTVALVMVAWLLGTFGDELPGKAVKSAGLLVHISAGLGILLLLALRLVWRFIDRPPSPEQTPFGKILEALSRLTHLGLYFLLAATPILGIALQLARGDALPIVGIGEITSPWVQDRAFAHALKEIHEVFANVLIVLASLHALAAIVHHWVWHDRTLARMLPRIAR